MTRVNSKTSFINFVYPFLFDGSSFSSRVKAARQAAWEINQNPAPLWESQKFDMDELLAHVADFLNTDKTDATAQLWKLQNTPLTSQSGGLGAGLASRQKVAWYLESRHNSQRFEILEVHLILFRIGVGFVTVKVQPWGTEEVAAWVDLLNAFRFGIGKRDVNLRLEKQERSLQNGQPPQMAPFFPRPAGGLEQHPQGKGTLYDLLHALLNPLSLPEGEPKWWKDVFIPGHWLPYAALFLHDLPHEQVPDMLFRLRNFYYLEQELSISNEDLKTEHPMLLPFGSQQWFFFSLEGGGFVAFDPLENDFYLKNLPDHLAKQYYLLFLLALQQRFALMMLLERVAHEWPLDRVPEVDLELAALEERRRIFERLRNDLQSFTARGFFAQAMQRQNHHRCYLKWQEVFQLERLYSEVSQEVRYLFEDLQADYERMRAAKVDRLRSTLEFFGFLFGPPALYLSYLDAIGNATHQVALVGSFSALLVGGLLFLIMRRVVNKP